MDKQEETIEDIQKEASEIRKANASVDSGLRRPGEEPEAEPEKQDIENPTESEPDEESEEEPQANDTVEEPETKRELKHGRRPQGSRENALRRMLQREQEARTALEAKIAEYQEAATKAEQRELADEIKDLATELKLDPEGLGKIFNKFESLIDRKFSSKLPPQDLVTDFQTRKEAAEEAAYFEEEWTAPKFQEAIESSYPRATARQLTQAKELMDELSHSEDGGRVVKGPDGKERLVPYPLDYILWAHKEDFDAILSSKRRHGIESANRASIDETADEDIDRTSAKGMEALDKKYRDMEAGDSGLRRGRSPRERDLDLF